MTRQTSAEAYNTIKENGMLSERRWQVYHVLYKYGPMTGGETFKALQQEYSTMAPPNSNTITRLGELRDLGVAVELGEKVCSVTGMNVILWDVTNKLPVKFEKPNRHTCRTCGGKGYIEEAQGKLF